MRLHFAFLTLALFFLSAQNGGPPGFAHWTSRELTGYAGTLRTDNQPTKVASQDLGKWGNHWASITKRTGDGVPELHESVVDFFVVEAGEATLVVGGRIAKPKTISPGEVRGTSIVGGERRMLKPGDVVHIPHNTAHQLLVPKQFLYYVIKVQQK